MVEQCNPKDFIKPKKILDPYIEVKKSCWIVFVFNYVPMYVGEFVSWLEMGPIK